MNQPILGAYRYPAELQNFSCTLTGFHLVNHVVGAQGWKISLSWRCWRCWYSSRSLSPADDLQVIESTAYLTK